MEQDVEITDRMREVLHEVYRGHPNPIIAQKLGISVKTVEKHRQQLNLRFKVDNPVSLVVTALRQGHLKLHV